MLRFPWRVRSALLALVNSVAAVFVTLGFATDEVTPWAAGAVAFVAVLADLGIVANGEVTTTPVDDPLGGDGLPLLPFRQVDELYDALRAGNVDRAIDLIGGVRPES